MAALIPRPFRPERLRNKFVPGGCSSGGLSKEKAMKISNSLAAGLLACAGFLGVCGTAHASTLEDIQKRGELRIAVQTQGPPFSMIDKNGARTGSSVELAKLMAQ